MSGVSLTANNKRLLGMRESGHNKNCEGVRFSDRWRTPQWLFDKLDSVFKFDFDMCACDDNHKCNEYLTYADDATTAQIPDHVRSIFCNPPFSSTTKQKILARSPEIRSSGKSIVFILPADISNVFYYDLIYGKADRVLIINGRINYAHPETGDVPKSGTGIGTMIVVYRFGYDCGTIVDNILRDDLKKISTLDLGKKLGM